MVSNSTISSQPAKPIRMWFVGTARSTLWPSIAAQYEPGVHLLLGYHLFGVFQITELRLIMRSFFEMMGFNPVCMHANSLSCRQLNFHTDISSYPIAIRK